MNNMMEYEQFDVIKGRINDTKTFIKNELATYSQCAKSLKDALGKKQDAEKKLDKKANDKNKAAADEANKKYESTYAWASESLSKLLGYIEKLNKDWNKLIYQYSQTDEKKVPKEKSEFDKYVKDVDSSKKKVDDLLADAGIELNPVVPEDADAAPVAAEPVVEDAPVAEPVVEDAPAAEPVVEDVPVAEPAAEPVVVNEPSPARNLAPVSIDISEHVEKVVVAAMGKLSGALEKRIDDYFASYVPEVPAGLGATAGAGIGTEVAALQEKIAEDEKALLDKLVAVVETLKKLNTDMATVISTYDTLDARNKEILETQRVTNDMQRHTLREQQGVQINQRVVNTDQLKITEDQVAIIDLGKKSAEEQKRIASAQDTLIETQKAIADTQASIEDALKAVVADQKKLIAAQQSIITENAKQVEAHKAIREAQVGVADSQKEVLNAQKQVAKDQKSNADRQKETADLQKALNDEVKDILKAQKATKVKKPQA